MRSKKFARRTLLAILILIIPAFVIWGAGEASKKPVLIGVIGKQKIYLEGFLKSLDGAKVNVLLNFYANSDTFNNILQNRILMNRLAWERLVLLAAAKAEKTNITNNQVLALITQHPLFQRGGGFDKEVYHYIIKRSLQMDPRQFEELVRENLRINSFFADLFKSVTISDNELLELYKNMNDKADISYFLVPKDMFTGGPQPSMEELQSYYDKNHSEFMTAAKIDLEYMKADYKDQQGLQEVAKKINGFYPTLQASPEKFQDIAKENGLTYERTGLLTQDNIIPGVKFSQDIYDMAFRLEKGAVSPPIASSGSDGSVYILRKVEEAPSSLIPFEEAKNKVTEIITDKKLSELAVKKAEELYNDIKSGKITFVAAAESVKSKVQDAKNIGINSYIENIGPAAGSFNNILKAGDGGLTPPFASPKGSVILRTDKIIPADMDTFAKTKDALYKQLLDAKRTEFQEQWFREKAPKAELKQDLDKL